MNYMSINPGLKIGLRQAFTITLAGRIFFLTYDTSTTTIEWNMFMDDLVLKAEVEKILKNHLTNQ